MRGLLGCCFLAGGHAAATTPGELADKHGGGLVERGQVAGVALVIRDGADETRHFYGTTALDGGRLPDEDTRFEIGSITKTLTAALLVKGVRDGRYGLDTPVHELLGDDAHGLASTLAALACHHSGLPRLPDNFRPAEAANPYVGYDAGRLGAFLADYQPPAEAPGYAYSNLGYAVLGHALAVASGTSFAELLGRDLLAPLGMASAETIPEVRDRAAWALPHVPRRLRLTGPAFRETANWDFEVFAPAGSVAASADDMARYLKALLHPEGTALEGLTEELYRKRHDIDGRLGVGLGWHFLETGGVTAVWHNGGTGGYSSFMGFVPERGIGIVLLSNTANTSAVDQAAVALLEGLLAREMPP